MTIKYTYSVTKHIHAKKVNRESLVQEIEESVLGSRLHWLECKSDIITVWMREPFFEDEKLKMEEILHHHDGERVSQNSLTKKGEMKVAIQEETTKTGGHFQSQTFLIDVQVSEEWQMEDITFPIPISLLNAQISVEESMDHDEGRFFISPDLPIGAAVYPVKVGDKEIKVSSTVIDHTATGYWLGLFNGVKKVELGRVTAIDAVNGIVRMENGSEEDFMPSAAMPVYVLQTVKMVPYFLFKKGNHLNIGGTKIGGSYLPPGFPIRMFYKNNGETKKTFSIDLEYLY